MPRPQPVLLGINHHLLYPESLSDPVIHEETLPEVLKHKEFHVVDCFLADHPERRRREIESILRSRKYVIYNCPLFAMFDGLGPSSPDETVRGRTVALAHHHIRRAKLLPTLGIVVASGPDPGPERRADHQEAFIQFLLEVADEAAPIPILLEPFDRGVDKRFLIGPTEEAVALVEAVRQRGCVNVGLLVDMGHLPLMNETFEHALRVARGCIRHVHLGSCVLDDPSHPLFGDTHPPIGMQGGKHTETHLKQFLESLDSIGYFGGEICTVPTVTLEQRPYPGISPDESVRIWLDMLDRQWPRRSERT